jgi:PMR5 N terminal Domain
VRLRRNDPSFSLNSHLARVLSNISINKTAIHHCISISLSLMVILSRRGKPLEQVRPIWFFFAITITLFLVLFCIIYFDCGSLLRWDGKAREIRRGTELHKAFGVGNASSECDWFDGEWIWDEKYPLYNSKNCPFLDLGFRCSENGRSVTVCIHTGDGNPSAVISPGLFIFFCIYSPRFGFT